MRATIIRMCCLFSVAAAGCTERSPSAPTNILPPAPPAPAGVVASDARPTSVASARAAATATMAYVSALPGTFPGARFATVRNHTRAAEHTTPVLDGGFDPIAVPAESGDDLSLELMYESGSTVMSVKVPPRRPPSVVRTSPTRGRIDVALSVQVVVVFTEPIDKTSVDKTSLLMKKDGQVVNGTFTVSEDGLNATFTPDGELLPATTYEIDVTSGIRDLDGEHLDHDEVVTFTTLALAPAPTPPPPGSLAFVSTRDGMPHIYIANPDGSEIRRLTNSTRPEFTPEWSRDGSLLAFNTDSGTYVIRRDGTGLVRLPVGGDWPSWAPDGKTLLVATETGLRLVPADGSAGSVALGQFAAYSIGGPWAAKLSPDGRVAFSAWIDGPDFQRAFIMNLDGSAGRTFVKPINGAIWDECGPVWSPDGTRIALLGGVFGGLESPAGIFAVGIVNPEFGVVTSITQTGTTCWDSNYDNTTSFSGIAWSPDGTALAITKRDPGWRVSQPFPKNQRASIVIVDIARNEVRATIPDAYDPSWSPARQ